MSPLAPARSAAAAADRGFPARPHLVLASASPRRRELLAQIGIVADRVCSPEVDERSQGDESPRSCALRLSRAKASAVVAAQDEIVLAADTVVAIGRRLLGKPEDTDAAAAYLRLLSGRRHRVTTGVAVRRGAELRARAVVTVVRFKRLTEPEIAGYLATGDWDGKAGAYAIQGRAGAFIPWIGGSYSNVVGLPLTETLALLASAGWYRDAL